MKTATHKPTPKAIVAALKPFVVNLIMLKAVAQVERERVDAIEREELRSQNYYGRHRDGRQFRVTEPKQSYLMDTDSSERYFDKLKAIHLANGFKAAAEGNCPALTAEHEQVKAEWALIEAAQQFFPDVTNNKLLCGTKDMDGLTARQKYLDLLCGLVVSAK